MAGSFLKLKAAGLPKASSRFSKLASEKKLSYPSFNKPKVSKSKSLKDFDLERLRGLGYIIAVNDAGKEILFADAWITIDPWGLHGPQLPPEEFKGKLYAGVSEDYNTPACQIN